MQPLPSEIAGCKVLKVEPELYSAPLSRVVQYRNDARLVIFHDEMKVLRRMILSDNLATSDFAH